MIKINEQMVTERKKQLMDATWRYLLKKGIGHASIGELCTSMKVSQSSLYYFFKNRDDLYINSGKYGLTKVVDELFKFTLNHTENIQSFFNELLNETEKYKHDLRLGVQLATSPVYGDFMREKADEFHFIYDRYAERLQGIFKCTRVQAETFIYSVIAYVIDYAIWDDREKTQMLLDNLHERIISKLK